MERSLKTWKGGFAPTTRPGHGERRIVSDIARQHTLQELKQPQAHAYVRWYFAERQCFATLTEPIVKEFEQAWGTQFGRLLRRPLYLKAWCDFVADGDGKSFPVSLGQLADQLQLRTLKARKQFESLSSGPCIFSVQLTGSRIGSVGWESISLIKVFQEYI